MGTDLEGCGGGGVDCSLRERLGLARLEDACADARNLPRSLVARLARWSWQRSRGSRANAPVREEPPKRSCAPDAAHSPLAMRAPGDCNPRPRTHDLQLRSHAPVDREMSPFRLGGEDRKNLASRQPEVPQRDTRASASSHRVGGAYLVMAAPTLILKGGLQAQKGALRSHASRAPHEHLAIDLAERNRAAGGLLGRKP